MNKLVIAIFFFVLTLGVYAQKKDFYGSNFTVKYPANFTAEGSMPSANNDDTFVSAIFTSPDKKVCHVLKKVYSYFVSLINIFYY